ncbi:PHB domain-containing protein [Aphelenchoides besseyi]|nr:PHB domain-containing protein [Aphelenchoides besseyi]
MSDQPKRCSTPHRPASPIAPPTNAVSGLESRGSSWHEQEGNITGRSSPSTIPPFVRRKQPIASAFPGSRSSSTCVLVDSDQKSVKRLRHDSCSAMAALAAPTPMMGRRKSTFAGIGGISTPMMSRKRSIKSHMSELESLAAQRRATAASLILSTTRKPSRVLRSARIDLLSANIQNEFGICGFLLTALSYILIVFTLPFSACLCIKVVQEYERAVIFRLGRLMPGGARGPGIFFVVPCIDSYRKVDLRVLSFEVPPQEILSKDSVTVAVDAVVYFRISNATISVTNVEDCSRSTKLLAQTTLRNILGTKTLAEMLSDREAVSLLIQDVRLPVQLQRAMATEAEAAREARAKVIVAEGEQKASRALKEAAEVIAQSPSALQLRYLQTLNSIAAEKNSTIVFPLPIDLLSSFLHRSTSKPDTLKQHTA